VNDDWPQYFLRVSVIVKIVGNLLPSGFAQRCDMPLRLLRKLFFIS
jgi:hypothetical protein